MLFYTVLAVIDRIMTTQELLDKHKGTEFEFVNFYKNRFMYQLINGNVIVSFDVEYRDSLNKIENIEELLQYDNFVIH